MPPNLDVYYGGADDDYTHRGGMSRAYGEFSRSGDSERSPYYHGRGNHDAAPPPHPPPATARRRGRPVASSNGGGKASNGRTVVDFEDFSTDAEKLSAILKLGDVEMHKHMLSADYYRFRKYLLLAPTVLSGLSIAIMGFVAASDVIEDRMKVGDASMRQFFVLLVSCLGFLVLVLTVLGNGLDYVTKLASHRAAAEDLTGLCDRVRLYRMERAMDERARDEEEELGSGVGGTETTDESDDDDDDDDEGGSVLIPTGEDRIMLYRGGGGEGAAAVAARRQIRKKMRQTRRVHRRNARLTRNLVDDKVRRAREEQDLSKDAITFYGYHTELRQISRGCRSDVPPRISKFFSVMENRVELMSLSRLGVEEDSRMRKNQIVRLCANEIYNEVSNYPLWPVFAPSVDRTIEGAMRRVGQLLNMNYRARRRCKLVPCCPVPLCCKKKTSDNVFVIINEGIDQRELDLMQAERIELLRMERDRRDRRNAGPEEVLVVNDTFYVDDGRHGRGGGAVPRLGYRSPPPKMIGNDDERSGATRDPEGSVFTPASGAHTRAGDGDGDSQSYSFKTGKREGGMYPQDRDGYMIEEDEYGMMDDDVDYVSRYSASEFEGGEIAKKSKKSKKKSKKSKKKSKKSKTKKKDKGDSGEDTDEYDEEGYPMVEYDEEHGTVFSERYSAAPSSKKYSAAGSHAHASEVGEDHGTIHSEKDSVASKSQYSAASKSQYSAAPPGVGGGSNYSFAPSSTSKSSGVWSSPSSKRYSAASGSAAAAASQVKEFSVLSPWNSSGQASSKKYPYSGKSDDGRGSKFSTASGAASGKFSVQSSRGVSAASSGRAVSESDGGRSQFSGRSSRRSSAASSGRSSAQSAMHSEQTDGRSEYSAQSAMHRSGYSSHSSARNSERTSMHSGASTQHSEGGGSAGGSARGE